MEPTFGIIVGNRGFFPDELAATGRTGILSVLESAGYGTVCLEPEDTKGGAVETRQDASKCADLFRRNADRIDGIIVTLPNFGDERGVAETIRMARLDVPVLVHAVPDTLTTPGMGLIGSRRDSFCGKISVCNNLVQYGLPFSLTQEHTTALQSLAFRSDMERFAGVCRVVRGFRNLRVGAIGARPSAFNTVRFSEKILQAAGISVETCDLSELVGRANRLQDSDPAVIEKVTGIQDYCEASSIDTKILMKMARLGVVIDEFVRENQLDTVAVQCWTALQEFYGVVPCTLMSMMSNSLVPAACEVDVGGALAMYALQCASGTPSALLDWNNNYPDDPDKCVLFHCSNVPRHFFGERPKMDYQAIIAGSVGQENTYGTCVGRIQGGPLTFARFMSDDEEGLLRTYVGEGSFIDEDLDTFGGYGVARIENLQVLLQYICRLGFEHHVAVSHSECADILAEAFTTYLGFRTYHHE
jgi:L-fucose isomerase-like protein